MDIFLLQSLVTEIAPLLIGHRPDRIWQLGLTDLMIDFNLRNGGWLRLSTDPLRLGLYLTDRHPRRYANPPRQDTPFVALCRKHLEGTRLSALDPLGYDRVVRFTFTSSAGPDRFIIVQLTGRTANVLLLEGRKVLAELREHEEPPEYYADPAPPGDRIDPFSCPPEQIARQVTAGEEVAETLQRRVLGITPLLAREFSGRCAVMPPEEAWRSLIEDLLTPTPTIYANPPLEELRQDPGLAELTLLLSSIPLHHLPARFQVHPATLNEAADQYFSLLEERRQFTGLRQRLASLFNTRLKRLHSLLANLDREAEKYGSVERWQRDGDLLLTNLHEALRTENGSWLVVDYFDPEQNLIEIDGAEGGTALETAEHYFRLARKGRHSRESIAARRPPVLAEIASLREDQESLSTLTNLTTLQPLADKYGLGEERLPALRPAKTRSAGEAIPGVRRYRSSDGYEILVGRNDRDNDHLTLRVARSFDLWLHAADYPGSHVILRNPKRQPVPARAIAEAAQLAAKFSQARDLPKAAVNYCEKKFVTKPKGFAPGQVRLASFRTILVEPAEAGERI